MWQLIKYPRFSKNPVILGAYAEFPPYQEISTELLTANIRPDKIPKVYLGGPVERDFHTYRIIMNAPNQQEAYWAELTREQILAREFVAYGGIKGMSALSKADRKERDRHADE